MLLPEIDIVGYSLYLANDLTSGESYYDVYDDGDWIGEIRDMSFQSIDEETDEVVVDEDLLLELIDDMKVFCDF